MGNAIRTADDYRCGSAFRLFFERKFASHAGFHVEHLEEVGRDHGDICVFRGGARTHGRLIVACVSVVGHVRKCCALIAPVAKVRRGHLSVRSASFPQRGKGDDAIWIAEGQRLQQNGVDNAEHSRVRANTESHHQYCDGRESRILAQHARRKPQILQKGFQHGKASPLAIAFLRLCHSAQLHKRLPACLVHSHSAA